MATLPQAVWFNTLEPLFYPLGPSTVSIKNVKGNIATFSTIGVSSLSSLSMTQLNANLISCGLAYISSISTTNITLDGNTLGTGGSGFGADLLLNGVPIATVANLSSIADWAYEPAVSTIDCDNNDIKDAKDINCVNLAATNSVSGVIGGFTTLNTGSIVNSGNILTNTLQATGLLRAASISTPNLKANLITIVTGLFSSINASTISTATLTAGVIEVSSLAATTGSFSTILVSSIILPPAEEVSSITIDNLTVNVSANFSGSRPNFTTGINTSGPNNFNNTNLDNCGQINAATLSLNAGALSALASGTASVLVDSGGSILTNSAISLATQNGGSSVINIAAKRNALLAYPVPLSQVNITAEGNCPNIPVVPLTPYGGAVNIVACNGPSPIFPLVAVTDAFAPGAIHLTAYSKALFPGLITESAGSILAYSGLTNPTAGLYGCSFYSALTCLSLTAGLGPALTSFPGTVYLRGDNGTKVLNGLYIDHLYPAAGYTLAISGAGGCNVTIDDCSYIGMSTNPVIDGGNVNGQIRNFSTISALKLLTPTLNVSTISTGTVSVDQIYTRNININPPSTVYTVHPDLTINANLTTDEADDPQPNNLNLYASSNINIQSFTTGGGGGNINIQCGNNPAFYSINITGDTYVSRTLTANLGMSTTNINLSSINGAAYVPGGGGGGWVSTATSALDMAGFDIYASSTQLLSIGTNTSFTNAISFSNYGGVLGDIKMRSYNIDIGDNQNGTIGIRSGSGGYASIDAGNIWLRGTVNMCNNSINNIYQLNFSNSANIDGTYPNQLNFNASNSYFLGNLRFFGSGRTLDIADNIIQNVTTLYGSSGGFLTINAVNGMVIENNQGADLRLNTNADIGLKTLSTAQISIYQTAGSDFTLFNNGDARMNAKRNADIQASGNINIVSPSTNQVTISQTAGSDFVLFNNGDTRMNAKRNAFVEAVGDANMIAGGNVDIRTVSSQYITIQQTGAGNQSYIQLRPAGNIVVNARDYVELTANAGAGGIYCSGAFTELRGYLTFNAVNNYINNLEHIYGDTTAPGGGLAIDYMYGLFFNGTGRNANLYIDAGNLNMINYNSGINIANYNSNGTGNLSLYSASNDMYLGTATGYDINLNGGRYVSVNAAQPGGSFGIYASTINATSLQDINITATLNTNITATQNIQTSAVSTINTVQNTYFSGSISKRLDGMGVVQPVIQYGEVATSGGSGNITVPLPAAYTAINTYVAFACMEDTSPAEISVVRTDTSNIEVYWANGGGGSHTIVWNTLGT